MEFTQNSQWWIFLVVALCLIIFRFIFTHIMQKPNAEIKEDVAQTNPMLNMFSMVVATLTMLVPFAYIFFVREMKGFVAILVAMVLVYGTCYWLFMVLLKRS